MQLALRRNIIPLMSQLLRDGLITQDLALIRADDVVEAYRATI
jgi:hypothetical protein